MPETGIERVRVAAEAPARDLRKTGLDPDFWYPVTRSTAVKRGKTYGVTFAGDPIVLVRPQEGAVFALENRCAHRQVPLDAGVVCPKGLQCGYHGWTYDATGRCVSVPYLGKDKTKPNGVRSYPCREEYGLIFIFAGDAALAPTVPFPDIPSFADPNYKTRFLNRQVACHYSFMHENLMDMNHQFLHRRLMGSIQTRFLGLRPASDKVEVDYTFSRVGGGQHIGEKFILGKRSEATEDRAKDLMTIATEYPYQTLRFWTAGSNEPALDLWNVYIPVDAAQRVNHTFGLMMIRRPGIPGLINLLWPFIVWFTESIFAEDRTIVEAEQRAFDRQGEDCNQEIFPVVNALRTLLLDRGVPIPEDVVRDAIRGT